jgi:hypothetical protein
VIYAAGVVIGVTAGNLRKEAPWSCDPQQKLCNGGIGRELPVSGCARFRSAEGRRQDERSQRERAGARAPI